MKYLVPLCLMLSLAAALVALLPTGLVSAQDSPVKPRQVLTNDSIISLTKARFKERMILTLIRTSQTRFDISTAKLVELKKHGVGERVINGMIEVTTGAEIDERQFTLRDDEFFTKGDKAFFDETIFNELPGERRTKRTQDEAMIFGSQSGGGSKTQSRGYGPNGERQQQSEATGSATVRIVRPSDDGPDRAMPKLERAPKLDNRGVIEMMQGGFTEGTIIRKIESSQVEFDLAPKAVQEMKKNRISERIISAMRTAMDESK